MICPGVKRLDYHYQPRRLTYFGTILQVIYNISRLIIPFKTFIETARHDQCPFCVDPFGKLDSLPHLVYKHFAYRLIPSNERFYPKISIQNKRPYGHIQTLGFFCYFFLQVFRLSHHSIIEHS